jgi:Ca2+-transporting ATPase
MDDIKHQTNGLSEEQARQRLQQYGPNRIELRREVRFAEIFWEEVREPMILLLLAVTLGYFILREPLEAVAVLLIVTAILFVEVWTEYRAKASVAALQTLTESSTLVLRDGEVKAVPVEDVVPGDCMVLRAGSRIPADGYLIQAYDMAIDESALTGESFPSEKKAVHEDESTQTNREHQVFRGTLVIKGEGLAIAAATGLSTEIGRIAGITRTAKPPRTPLQQMMKQLSKVLAIAALLSATLIPILLIFIGGQKWSDAVLTGLSLAFATIPEELPILVVMVLGLGSLRLARSNALVRKLNSAETLGHITAVITDKTGTLTQNHQQFIGATIPGWEPLIKPSDLMKTPAGRRLSRVARLSLLYSGDGESPAWGDPLETALAESLPLFDFEDPTPKEAKTPIPFSSERGWSGITWGQNHRIMKGIPEIILNSCKHALHIRNGSEIEEILTNAVCTDILQHVGQLAEDGYRVLGLAEDDTFLGLLVFADPLRQEAADAVSTVLSAGVKVIMATGDHPNVARLIAKQIGLPDKAIATGEQMDQWNDQELGDRLHQTTVFARIKPEHKLRLVRALQAQNEVVAMIGDGINDAPAIAAADVGVAMGKNGTDAARENAGIVLTDDRFETLAKAVQEGRGLFANLQKAVRYYLAVKVALVTTMLIPAVLGWTSPFSPIMIILMELFMDLAASAAFVIEPAEEGLMDQPPRPADKPFLDSSMNRSIITGGLALSAAILLAVWAATGWSASSAEMIRSSSFTAWMWGHVLLAFVFRYMYTPPYRHPFANRILNAWAIGAITTAILLLYVPMLESIFGTAAISLIQWAWILGVPLVMAVILAATRSLWQGEGV